MKNNKTATAQSATANKATVSTATAQTANKVKIDKVTHLAPNVTGKQLLNAKLEANKLNKEELQSLSFCIAQFKKHGANVVNCFKALSMDEITPKNILPHLSEAEKMRLENNGNKFTVWLVENLVTRYGKSKK